MAKTEDFKGAFYQFKRMLPGAIASLLTQPLDVIKTNMINSPTLYFRELHGKIIDKGYRQYMRGTTIAVIRQAYGFAVYTSIISNVNKMMDSETNKFFSYSVAAVSGKAIAMILEAPLTLLKTRMEVISSSKTLQQEISEIIKGPKNLFAKGLLPTLGRQCVFSLVHYNAYRFLKDQVFDHFEETKKTFISAFFGSILAITLSQPLEVIRSRISLTLSLSIWECGRGIWIEQGWRGFIVGYIPRLLRKPINSGICWTLIQKVY